MIFALPSPAATPTMPNGLRSIFTCSFSATSLSLRSMLCRSMLWMKTSKIWPRSRKYSSTLLGWFECTCTLKRGFVPTHSSQSPIVAKKSSASAGSSVSECTRNSLQ